VRSIRLLQGTLCLALVFTLGCSSNKGKIEGTKWVNVASNLKGQPVPEGLITLEFGSDKKLLFKAGFQTLTGTYSLGMGNNVTFNLDQEHQGRKNHLEKITIEGDTLTMTDNEGTISFKKVN
jgi:hypothetical protein